MAIIQTQACHEFTALQGAVEAARGSDNPEAQAVVAAFDRMFGDPAVGASAIADYGLTPITGFWKLFDVDGWPLLVSLVPRDEDDGYSIKYATAFDELGNATELSIGYAAPDGDNDKALEVLKGIFGDIGRPEARQALQTLIDQAAPPILEFLGREGGSMDGFDAVTLHTTNGDVKLTRPDADGPEVITTHLVGFGDEDDED